jgi:hypothetical protein
MKTTYRLNLIAVALVGALMLALSTGGTAARAAELAGAKLPDTLSAGDKTMKLNGLGLRKKSIVNVYVGALYLASPSKDAGAILAADQAKAIRLHFLRDLTKKQLVDAFQEGFEGNAPDKAGQKAAFDKMLALVPDVKEGQTLTFADAVFSIWLGPKPPSDDLKKGMLG